jgi:hypothetical protein
MPHKTLLEEITGEPSIAKSLVTLNELFLKDARRLSGGGARQQ